jgi:hypothetical protein
MRGRAGIELQALEAGKAERPDIGRGHRIDYDTPPTSRETGEPAALRWGMLTYGPALVAASVKVLEEPATPDVQCLLAPGSFAPGPLRRLDDTPGMTARMWQMRPLSRGYVEARSNRPGDPPAADTGDDRRVVLHPRGGGGAVPAGD